MKQILQSPTLSEREYLIIHFQHVKGNDAPDEKGMMRPFNVVDGIYFDFPVDLDKGMYMKAYLNPMDIKALYEKVVEIEKAKVKPVPAEDWFS